MFTTALLLRGLSLESAAKLKAKITIDKEKNDLSRQKMGNYLTKHGAKATRVQIGYLL